jgi:glycosyltransferase involved in cell wall biosynthesis
LAQLGVKVIECRVSTKLNSRQRAAALAKQFSLVADRCDVIVLAEFNQTIAWPIAAMARNYRKKLIVDAFTSVYDSAVHDRATARPRSISALRYWLIDFVSFHLPPGIRPHRIITDTDQHRCYYQRTFRADPAHIAVIPVGASREWFEAPSPRRDDGCTLVSFFGTYIPLHGIETILRAAHHLRATPNIRFEIIGRGQTYSAMQNFAAQLGPDHVEFRDQIPPDALPSVVARADICLGSLARRANPTRDSNKATVLGSASL